MAPEEHLTYFGYREGYDSKVLQLGSLVWDYANPMSKRPYLAEIPSNEELSTWVSQDHRTDCYMKTERGRGVQVGTGLLDYATVAFQGDKNEQLIVAAKTGSKTYLLQPHEYLEKHILTSPSAQTWLSTRLAISQHRKLLKNLTFNHPKLWMLTGIYTMSHATTMTVLTSNTNTSANLSAPVPDQIGVSTLLNLKAGAKLEVGTNGLIESGAVFEGERVWAAQWHEIKAQYVVSRDGTPKMPSQVYLTDKVSIRTGRGENSLAALELGDEVVGEECGYDEADWEDFDRRLDDVLAFIDEEEDSDDDE